MVSKNTDIDEAFEYHQKGALSTAASLYQKIIQQDPQNGEALHLLGLIYYQQNKPAKALPFVQKAVILLPKKAHYHNHLGLIQKALGNQDAAEIAFNTAISIDPQYHDAFINLGNHYQHLGNLDAAEVAYRKAIHLDPDHSSGFNNLGALYVRTGHPEEALTHIQKALVLDPRNAEACHNLGSALSGLNRLEEAAAILEKSIQIDSENPEAHNTLADVYRRLGRFEDARNALECVLKLNPDHALARHMVRAVTNTPLEKAASDYVIKLYEGYANHFESHLQGILSYDVPQILRRQLDRLKPIAKPFKHVLDLGCGTGLAGKAIRDIAEELVGVDLSPKMLAIAREKGIYDRLIEMELLEYLAFAAQGVDLCMATDVFIYVGDLSSIFQILTQRLAPKGCLAFSSERQTGADYRLRSTGRFAHGESYIRDQARQNGFEILWHQTQGIRKESNQWLMGDLFIMVK